MTDLRHFKERSTGYYRACWVDDRERVSGWIPKPFGEHVDNIAGIPKDWVEPPFFAALWNLNDVEVIASSLKDLQEIQRSNSVTTS